MAHPLVISNFCGTFNISPKERYRTDTNSAQTNRRTDGQGDPYVFQPNFICACGGGGGGGYKEQKMVHFDILK